jgi:DNA-binding Lrp family transcriptional regulator
LTKPWDDDEGMPQREAAEYIDYSPSWVSNQTRDWEKGKLEVEINT